MQDTSEDMSNAENFKNALRFKLKPYLIRWGIVYGVLISFITFITVCISVHNWQFSQWLMSLFMDIGAVFDGDTIRYGLFVVGINHVSIIAAGVNVAGVFAFGVNAAGIFAIGTNTVGIIAIGVNPIGIIAIGVNAFGIITIGYYVAFGIVAIGQIAFGTYALSYSHLQRGRGKYLLAPHRQDPKAIDFFTRWFPKLTPTEY